MFPIAQQFVERVVLVSDDQIRRRSVCCGTSFDCWPNRAGPPLWPVCYRVEYQPRAGERVGVIVCGGNATDPAPSLPLEEVPPDPASA